MAFAILGTPNPQFFDSSGSPLASGTLAVLDPADDTNKASYPTYDDAEAATNANSNPITLDSRGSCTLWGLDGEDYKLTLKDVNGDTVWTTDDIFLPASDQASLGAILYPRNAAEISAGVTPVNYNYDVGNVLRYATNTTPGTTDMATAIQAAVDSSLLVYFPPGTYLCQTAITFRSNVHIYGYGATVQTDGTNRIFSAVGSIGTLSATTADTTRGATTFAAAAGTGSGYTDGWFMQSEEVKHTVDAVDHKAGELGVVTSVSTDTVTIQGLFCDTYTTANTAKAAPVTFIDNIKIEGLKLTNTQYDSAPTTATSSLIYFEFIKNSSINNCTVYENNQAGINVFNSLNCSVVNNRIERMRDYSTTILGYGVAVGYSSQNITISGNTFDRCRHALSTGTAASSLTPNYGVQRGITFSGNSVSNCTSIGIDTHEDTDGTTITGNSVTGCTPAGIAVRGDTNTITGNNVTACAGKGIRVAIEANHTTITGNTVRSIADASSDGWGIQVDGDSTMVSGNHVSNCARSGIYVFANTTKDIQIIGNSCLNNGQDAVAADADGIHLASNGTILGLTIVGNSCYDDQGSPTQQYGIRNLNTDFDHAYTVIANNMLYLNVLGPYLESAGEDGTFAGNTGIADAVDIKTLADEATPSVAGYNLFVTGGTANDPITNFDDGVIGQHITIRLDHGIQFTYGASTLVLKDGVNWTGAAGDVISFVQITADRWHEVSRSDNTA